MQATWGKPHELEKCKCFFGLNDWGSDRKKNTSTNKSEFMMYLLKNMIHQSVTLLFKKNNFLIQSWYRGVRVQSKIYMEPQNSSRIEYKGDQTRISWRFQHMPGSKLQNYQGINRFCAFNYTENLLLNRPTPKVTLLNSRSQKKNT